MKDRFASHVCQTLFALAIDTIHREVLSFRLRVTSVLWTCTTDSGCRFIGSDRSRERRIITNDSASPGYM